MAVDDASRKGDLAAEANNVDAALAGVPAKRKLAIAKADPARVPVDEKSKVVHIVRRLGGDEARRCPQKKPLAA